MKGFKTIGYVAVSILAVLGVPEIQALVVAHPSVAVVVNGVIVGLLRFITTSPIFKA